MRRTSMGIALAASIIACTAVAQTDRAAPPVPSLPDLTSFSLIRTDSNGSPIALTVDQAADVLKDYDVIFFGEWHDHPGNHLAEMALFRALHRRAPQLALSLEQFERDVQPALDDYLAGRIGEEALRRKGRAWSNYAESYRPLVEYAKENGLRVIASEVPTSIVRCVGQEGPEFLTRMSPEKRGWAAAELHLSDGPYKDKFMRFLAEEGSHGQGDVVDASGAPTASALRSYAAQVSRDDTMAESIFLHLQKNPGQKLVHIAGAFHVENALGTVERLKLRAPGLKIAVIAPVEVANPERPAPAAGEVAAGNFAVLLRASPKSYANEEERKAAMAAMGGTMGAPRRAACNL